MSSATSSSSTGTIGPDPAILDGFCDMSLKFFQELTQENHEHMPHVDKVSLDARLLLGDIAPIFCEIRKTVQSARDMFQDFLLILSIPSNEGGIPVMETREGMSSRYSLALEKMADTSEFEDIMERIEEFDNVTIKPTLERLNEEILKDRKSSKRWDGTKKIVDTVGPPGGMILQAFLAKVAIIARPIYDFGVSKSSQACEDLSRSAQAEVDIKETQFAAIKTISRRTMGAKDIMHVCTFQWTSLRDSIYLSPLDPHNNIISELPKPTIRPETKADLIKLFTTYRESLDHVYTRVKDLLSEINKLYGTSMTQSLKSFIERIQHLSIYLRRLESAGDLVSGKAKTTLHEHIREIAKCFMPQLKAIDRVLKDWNTSTCAQPNLVSSLTRRIIGRSTGVARGLCDFGLQFARPCERIAILAEQETKNGKGRRQPTEQTTIGDDTFWPVANIAQVPDILEILEEIYRKTFGFSMESALAHAHFNSIFRDSNLDSIEHSEFDPTQLPLSPFGVDEALVRQAAKIVDHEMRKLKAFLPPEERNLRC